MNQTVISQKILLFEDIDVVYYDEQEFHSQLLKLMAVTKIPIILTMSAENPSVKEYFKT